MRSLISRLLPSTASQRAAAALAGVGALLWIGVGAPAQEGPGRPGPDFASFEDEREASRWTAFGDASAEAAEEFPSWDTHSLRLRVPAGAAGGVETDYLPMGWDRREALQFFAYAEGPAKLEVEIRDGAASAARIAELKTGSNHVQLRLDAFAGVDLEKVQRLRLHIEAGARDAVIRLDRFRLSEYNEVLAAKGRMDADYSLEIETPHVAWARPYAEGPVRMLIVPDVSDGRAAIELAQRLEARLFAVTLDPFSGRNRWGFGDFYGERGVWRGAANTLMHTYLADDLINGPDYDVMVLPGSRPWEEFPDVVRSAIQRRVEQGMGLVLIDPWIEDAGKAADLDGLSALRVAPRGPDDDSLTDDRWVAASHYITRNVPLDALPYEQLSRRRAEASGRVLVRNEKGDPVLAVRDVGRGRVVTIAYKQRGLIPLVENQWRASATWPYWEYMYSLLARSVVWAGRKESAVRLDPIAFDRAENPSRVRLAVSGARAGALFAEVVFRDEFGETEKSRRVELDPSGADLELDLPARPHGRTHFVDVILHDAEGRSLDWGSALYRVPLDASIASIRFDADRFPVGSEVTGTVAIEGSPAGDSLLETRLFDNYGRLLAESAAPLGEGLSEIAFSLSSEGCLTRLARIEARLVADGRPRHTKRAEVFILLPQRWEHYDVVMYLFGPDPAPGLWNTIQQRLKEMYVTTLSSYPLELSKHANFGVQAQTRISGQESPDGDARKPYLEQKENYFRTKDKKHLARLYCLNDPSYLAQQEREISKLVRPWVPFSPMSYYIYEEPSLTTYDDALDLCFSRFCMARMRPWLKGEYGSLEALNRQWGTGFARWDEVTPDASEEARQRGNYSSWADHRTFMEITYAANYAYVKKLLRRHDPEGLVLLSGTQSSSPHNGADYSRLDFVVDHLNPYNHEGQIEFHRSFNPELRMSGGSGYGVHGRETLYNFYRNLFHGYWAGSYVFWQYSILNPDYRFCGSAKSIQDGYRELVDGGVAKLIRGARRDNYGVAIHYSYPSIHGAWIVDGRVYPPVSRGSVDMGTNWGATGRKFLDNRDGWTAALEDLGLQYDFVARQQIEAGELIAKGFRALVLPFSVSITDSEIEEIQKFVRAGGTVIADSQAGVMDGHAKWLPAGSLDDLFGVRRARPARREELAARGPDPGVAAAGAAAGGEIGGVPVLFQRSEGAGRAVYLNFFLADYIEQRRKGKAAEQRDFVRRALAAAGVEAEFRALTAGGEPLEDFELISYTAGAARLLGLLKNDDVSVSEVPLRLVLDRAYEVYDVRNKRRLGRTSVIEDRIRTGEPKLYALLPGPIRSIEVSAAASIGRGRRFPYDVKLDAPEGVDSAVMVRVYNPAGELVREYSENLPTHSGRARGEFRLALNDPQGRWKMVVRDAISGREAVHTFDLE